MRSPYAQSEYLKQFHPDYNSKAKDLAKEAGFDTLVPAPAGEGPIQR